MKNKLLIAGMAFFSLFALASCNNSSEDYSSLREVVLQDINSEYKTTLGYFYDSENVDGTATLLNTGEGRDYMKVYVAKDPVSSLFVYNYDLKGYFDAHTEKCLTVTISSATTTGKMYQSEKTSFANIVFNSEYGAKKALETVDFKDSIYSSGEFTKVIDCKQAYSNYSEDTSKTPYLSIVYLPTYVIHVIDGQDKLREFVFVPVYHEFTLDGNISGLRTLDLAKYIDANGVLMIKPEETE